MNAKNFQNLSWIMVHYIRDNGRAAVDMAWEIRNGQMVRSTQVYGRTTKPVLKEYFSMSMETSMKEN